MLQFHKYAYLLFFILGYYSTGAVALTVGTLAYNPPFELESSDNHPKEFLGFDIDLMIEVCLRIHEKCTFKNELFHQFPEMINKEKIDLAVGAIIITAERRNDFLYSLPYKQSYLRYITLAPEHINSPKDLKGKTLGVYLGSPSKAYVLKQFGNSIQVKTFRRSMDMLNALDKGQVSAILTNAEQATYWISNGGNKYKSFGNKFKIGEGYGVMAKLGRNELIGKINTALVSMEKDGSYLNIYKRYFK